MKATVHDLSRHILRLRRILQRVLASRDRAALQLANAIDELEWQRDINQQLGAENEQKQAQIDAMRPVVEAVATSRSVFAELDVWVLLLENSTVSYLQELVTQARAFVAAHPATDTDTTTGEE